MVRDQINTCWKNYIKQKKYIYIDLKSFDLSNTDLINSTLIKMLPTNIRALIRVTLLVNISNHKPSI